MEVMVDWEEDIRGLVDEVHLVQFGDTCWSIGLTRHMNATFRIAHLLDRTESLSVVHFVHSMGRMNMLLPNLALPGLSTAVPFLTDYGLILEDHFTSMCDFASGAMLPWAPTLPRFVVSEMRIHNLGEYGTIEEFEAEFFGALNHSPVAAVIPCYPSLDAIRCVHDFGIYSPPTHEILSLPRHSHLIFATGRGRFHGRPFVQFRDSAHGAFLNVGMGRGLITQFVELLGPIVVC